MAVMHDAHACGDRGRTAAAVARASRTGRYGLSLVEVMISLAITAMLLTAVAAAYSASSQAIRVNDQFFRATQAARVSMTQILDAVRKSESCQVGAAADQSLNVVTGKNNIDIIIPETETPPIPAKLASYVWCPNETDKPLKLTIDGQTHILARHIEDAQFTGVIEPNPDTGQRRTIRITIVLLVRVGGEQLRLSGSAVPRREMVY